MAIIDIDGWTNNSKKLLITPPGVEENPERSLRICPRTRHRIIGILQGRYLSTRKIQRTSNFRHVSLGTGRKLLIFESS